METIHVLKFGGTSLQDATLINQAADIISERQARVWPVVIVSAVGGVTDQLLQLADDVHSNGKNGPEIIQKLKTRHLDLLHDLGAADPSSKQDLEVLFDE
jgi:aspartokinase/homoserine dehydrogenase 1